ncbi:MAG: hypothetical protein ACI9SC_001281 [Gammaproteobacteria bacterium]|jgi:hypothetical protein
MFSVIRNISLGMIFGLGLVACGDDDKAMPAASADKAMPAATAAAPTASGDDIFSSMNIEKAEGVVYQDEIYANWPYN